MKRLFALILSLMCLFCSCKDDTDNPSVSELKTPVVTVDGELATWGACEGATHYEYKINDRAAVRVDADVLKIGLLNGESISVRAICEGENEISSDWSVPVSRIRQLSAPVVTQKPFGEQILISWVRDENATSYQYRLNSGSAVAIEENAFLINATDIFYIQALGDGVYYDNSEWVLVMPKNSSN